MPYFTDSNDCTEGSRKYRNLPIHVLVAFFFTLQAESTEDLLCKVSSSDMLKNHGIVTAMHLLNYTRNHSKLKQHVDTLDSNGMKCLAYVASELVNPFSIIF